MSKTHDTDLAVDAVPLDSGLQPREPGVQISMNASRSVTYQSPQSLASTSGEVPAVQTTPASGPSQQSAAPSVALHQPGPTSGPTPFPHGGTPVKEGHASESDQDVKKCSENSLLEDTLKGVRKAVAERLEKCGDSLFEPQSSVTLPSPSSLSGSVCDVTDKDIEDYRLKFPDKLKTDYYDAMILYMEDHDRAQVLRFLNRVRTEVLLNQKVKPKVILFDEIFPDSGMSPVGQLDRSLSYCTYIFLYVTKSFCEDGWTEFSSQTALMDAILNPDRKWSVVPIFTEPKRKPTYRVPPSVRSLKGIQYWSEDKFYADSLRKLLEDKMQVRLEREKELKHKRKLWIMEKKTQEHKDKLKRQQELELKKQEQEIARSMQEMALREHLQRQKPKFYLPTEEEFKRFADHYYKPKLVDDAYMKKVLDEARSKTSFSPSMGSHISSSEPAGLSELGNRDAQFYWSASSPEWQSGRLSPVPGYPTHPPGFAPHPRLGYAGYPYHVPQSLPGYDALFPPGYSASVYSHADTEDSMTSSHLPRIDPTQKVHPQAGLSCSYPSRSGPDQIVLTQLSSSFSSGMNRIVHPQNGLGSMSGGGPAQGRQLTSPSVVQPDASYETGSQNQVKLADSSSSQKNIGVGGGQTHPFTSVGEQSVPVMIHSVVAQSGRPTGGDRTVQSTEEGDFHSLPSRTTQGSSSEASGKSSFSFQPPVNILSGNPPAVTRDTVRMVGNSPAGSDSETVAASQEESLPANYDLQEDHPSASCPASLSQPSCNPYYNPSYRQCKDADSAAMPLMSGSVAEQMVHVQGVGHPSGTRTVDPGKGRGGYFPPQQHYGRSSLPFQQYPRMQAPGQFLHAQSYSPYMHSPLMPQAREYYRYPQPRSVYTEYPQQPPPVSQVHYHYHQDTPRAPVPQNINIEKAEQVMVGTDFQLNVKKSRGGRMRDTLELHPEDPIMPMPMQEEQVRHEDFEESGEVQRQGVLPLQTASVSPSFLPNPGSQLTEIVTPDQSRRPSYPCPSNEQTEAPLSGPYGYRDLATGVGHSHNQLEAGTMQSGHAAMRKPVGYASPFQQSTQTWRRNYDDENDTKLKQVGGGDCSGQTGGDREETSLKSASS